MNISGFTVLTRFTYTPTRGLQVIYTPPIEQSDWSEFTSYGTNYYSHIQMM